MLEFRLTRKHFKANYTIGELHYRLDGSEWLFLCHTLEDTIRAKGVKVYGKTAIPAGLYEFIMALSPHFKRVLPLLLKVPLFSSILIHGGLDENSTLGCILVGMNTVVGRLTESQKCLQRLLDLIAEHKQDKYRLEIC